MVEFLVIKVDRKNLIVLTLKNKNNIVLVKKINTITQKLKIFLFIITDHVVYVYHDYKLKNQDNFFLRISKVNGGKFQFFINKNKTDL